MVDTGMTLHDDGTATVVLADGRSVVLRQLTVAENRALRNHRADIEEWLLDVAGRRRDAASAGNGAAARSLAREMLDGLDDRNVAWLRHLLEIVGEDLGDEGSVPAWLADTRSMRTLQEHLTSRPGAGPPAGDGG